MGSFVLIGFLAKNTYGRGGAEGIVEKELREVSLLLGSRSGLSATEESLNGVALKLAGLVES